MRNRLEKDQVVRIVKESGLPEGKYFLITRSALLMYGTRRVVSEVDVCLESESFNRIAKELGREIEESPIGNKWFKMGEHVEVFETKEFDKYEVEMIEGIPVQRLEEISKRKKEMDRERDRRDFRELEKYLTDQENLLSWEKFN